jgi:predicted nucleotidyltransferase
LSESVLGKVIGDEAAAKMAGDFVENSTTALIDNYQKEKTTLEKFKNSIDLFSRILFNSNF